MHGGKEGGREAGRVQSMHCRPGCAEQDGDTHTKKTGRDASQDTIYNGWTVPFPDWNI